MGEIKESLLAAFAQKSSIEQDVVKAFLHNFSVTWSREYNRLGTYVSAYLLKPERVFSDTGYSEEILLAYSPYATLEPRVLRLCEEIFADADVVGRIEPYAFFLASDAGDIASKLEDLTATISNARVIVGFYSHELVSNKNDSWFVRQRFLDRIIARDIFDVRLPIHDEFGFFGRKAILGAIVDSVRKSENIGVFGLRKVGKTSILFQAKDKCIKQDIAEVVYLDCKRPDIWSLNWEQLLLLIIKNITGTSYELKSGESAAGAFREVMMKSKRRILLIFDEVEFISPISPLENGWKTGFVPFWQTIWAQQSETKRLSILIAGVNSSLVERSMIGKVQNPLFSLVRPEYLHGLKDDDLRSMVRLLGRKIGLILEYEPAVWLNERYGGHPLLTRLACSVLHGIVKDQGKPRPHTVTVEELNSSSELLDSGVMFYAEHVISSLKEAFKSEFVLLESLALGRRADFFDQAKNPSNIRHLVDYGLIRRTATNSYELSIHVVERYLTLNHSIENEQGIGRWICPRKQRGAWVKDRKYRILKDFRIMDQTMRAKNVNILGPILLPEAEKFTDSPIVDSESSFQIFINSANRTFVESVEQYGISIGKKDFFWNDVKTGLPHLWKSMHRIKLYRNEKMHLVLRGTVIADYTTYVKDDLGLISVPDAGDDIFFIFQQGILDSLLHSIQVELAKLGG